MNTPRMTSHDEHERAARKHVQWLREIDEWKADHQRALQTLLVLSAGLFGVISLVGIKSRISRMGGTLSGWPWAALLLFSGGYVALSLVLMYS